MKMKEDSMMHLENEVLADLILDLFEILEQGVFSI